MSNVDQIGNKKFNFEPGITPSPKFPKKPKLKPKMIIPLVQPHALPDTAVPFGGKVY